MARELAIILHNEVGWGKTTTYTVIKKCIDKGLVGKLCQTLFVRRLFPGKKSRSMKQKN